MSGQRAWLFKGAFFCLAGLSWATCNQAHAQALTPAQSGSASSFGLGYLPQAYSTGSPLGQSGIALIPIPMTASTGSQKTSATGTANSMATDPLGLGYVYGPAAIPMTQGQAGLFMLSTAQRIAGAGHWSAQRRPARGAAGGGNGQQRQDRRSCGGRPG